MEKKPKEKFDTDKMIGGVIAAAIVLTIGYAGFITLTNKEPKSAIANPTVSQPAPVATVPATSAPKALNITQPPVTQKPVIKATPTTKTPATEAPKPTTQKVGSFTVCANADQSKFKDVLGYMGPLSQAQVNKMVGC